MTLLTQLSELPPALIVIFGILFAVHGGFRRGVLGAISLYSSLSVLRQLLYWALALVKALSLLGYYIITAAVGLWVLWVVSVNIAGLISRAPDVHVREVEERRVRERQFREWMDVAAQRRGGRR